ncbi:MAG: type II secretion system F family protein [Candidatus Ozemobacteraceae bacterium]
MIDNRPENKEMGSQETTKPDSADRSHSLLVFCRLLRAAHQADVPLPRILSEAGRNLGDGRAEAWAKTLSERVAAGNDLASSIKTLENIDPLLAGLVKAHDENALTDVLTSYARHLVMVEKLKEGVKTALFYPCFVFQLSVINLILINLHLLPVMSGLFPGRPSEWPLSLQMLFITEPRTWPLSIPLPLFIITLAFLSARTLLFVSAFDIPRTLFGRLMGMGLFGLHEARARVQGSIAMHLQAGRDLADAILQSAEGLNDNLLERQLQDVASALKGGQSVTKALGKSVLLRDLPERWPDQASSEAVIAAFRFGRDASHAVAQQYPDRAERLGSILALLLLGIVVCLLCVAFFGPYFALTVTPLADGAVLK